ncbi:MAG: metallophosphoesterase, partial [Pseudomonadota bacterium]
MSYRGSMFRLAHISDPHLGPMPTLGTADYFNKRLLGMWYWRRNRQKHMTAEWLDGLVADLRAQEADHIAVTGDVTNLAMEEEFERGGHWLASLGAPENVSVIPGNHDAYVAGAFRKSSHHWASFMTGDDGGRTIAFPYLRRRGDVALIGTSTGFALPPFVAGGFFGQRQADRLVTILRDPALSGTFKIIMIHHPPHPGATLPRKALFDAGLFRRAVRKSGADLILHGHTHLPTLAHIDGPDGR